MHEEHSACRKEDTYRHLAPPSLSSQLLSNPVPTHSRSTIFINTDSL